MKKLVSNILITGLSLAVVLSSCTDLTETVYDEVTEENFRPDTDDLTAVIAPVYAAARGMFANRAYFWTQEETADAMLTPARPNGWWDGGQYYRMHTHDWTPVEEQISSVWESCFNGINAANRVIHQIESEIVPIRDSDQRERIIAEIKAARAFYYSILLDTYGSPPLVTDFTDTSLPGNSTRQEIYDFVVSELTVNIPLLSPENNIDTYGRFNQSAARAVLLKVYLNAEVYTGTPQWNNVITVADEIIGSNHFQLESDYSASFRRDNTGSPEIVFAIPFDSERGGGFQVLLKSLKPALQEVFNTSTGFWGGSASAPQFIESYQEGDRRLEDSWLRGSFSNAQGEEVIEFVKNVPDYPGETELGTSFEYGYPIGKYEIYEGMQGDWDGDFPWYRYSYVLLAKAEALLRTGSPDPAADLVEQVRMRAFEDPADARITGAELQQGSNFNYGWWDGVNQRVVASEGSDTEVTDGGIDIQYGRMLDEWGWEFAAEAKRRTQLIRFGVFTAKTWFNHTPNGDNKIIYPIPESTLENNPNLDQNDGY